MHVQQCGDRIGSRDGIVHDILPSNCVLSAGTYWVSVQANQNFTPNGQWGWTDRTVQSNNGAAFENPGGGFACPGGNGWVLKTTCVTGSSPDQVFLLIGTIDGACGTPTATPTNTPTATATATSTATATGTPTGTCTPLGTPLTLYDQTDNAAGTATSSQNFEPANDAFDDQTADDFVVPSGQIWNVEQVNVVGQYFNGTGPADSVNVFFYPNPSTLPGASAVCTFNNVAIEPERQQDRLR